MVVVDGAEVGITNMLTSGFVGTYYKVGPWVVALIMTNMLA